jgi:hypothetical protein
MMHNLEFNSEKLPEFSGKIRNMLDGKNLIKNKTKKS